MLDSGSLQEKFSHIEKMNAYQTKQISALLRIFTLKRKADSDYRLALEQVNAEVNRYLEIQPGFLSEMMKSFQSLLAITHTHKTTLLEGYENEVLRPLMLARDQRIDESTIKKVQFIEGKVNGQISLVQEKILKLKSLNEDIQISKTQARFKDRIGGMTQSQTISHSQKLRELYKLQQQTSQQLDKTVNQLQSIRQIYAQTKTDVMQQHSQHFNKQTQTVIDDVMRVFVIEVAYIRCIEHDVAAILKRLKENRDECKKGDATERKIEEGMKGENGGGVGGNIMNIRSFLWDTYKSMTKVDFKYNQPYVPEAIRKKIDVIFTNLKN